MTDAVVISMKELNRLRISARNEDQAANSRSEKNAELKRISEARYKTWDNTLEGLRRKKEAERVQRLRDEEERQLAIDRENQAEEDARRAVIIQRAHRMADESDDSLRRMKGSLMLSDVLEVRFLLHSHTLSHESR
jgi:membrane protein involved in colicin uptake